MTPYACGTYAEGTDTVATTATAVIIIFENDFTHTSYSVADTFEGMRQVIKKASLFIFLSNLKSEKLRPFSIIKAPQKVASPINIYFIILSIRAPTLCIIYIMNIKVILSQYGGASKNKVSKIYYSVFFNEKRVSGVKPNVFKQHIVLDVNVEDKEVQGILKMEENKKTYTIHFRCVNCGKAFTEEFEKGFPATEEGFGNNHFVRKSNKLTDYVTCPNCGVINIRKVLPLNKLEGR